MTAVGEASRGVPDALVGENANSVRGQHQPSRSISRQNWAQSYISRLIWSDAIVVVLAVVLAHSVRFGQSDLLTTEPVSELSYALISAGLVGLWLIILALFRTRSRRVIGAGHSEYQRVVSSTARLFGFIAIIALVFRLELARGYLA